MPPYRILSIDGGGIRGVIPVTALQWLSAVPDLGPWLDRVDLLAGTSTGGIIALALAAGKPLTDLHDLYHHRGDAIFRGHNTPWKTGLRRVVRAAYSNRPLLAEMERLFGDLTLGDLNKRVAVCAFQLARGHEGWNAKIFHNYPGVGNDASERVVDVALATSAGPTYLPTWHGYVDGGVFANNPSMVALAQALDHRNEEGTRQRLQDLVMLSLGTGVRHPSVEGQSHDWGVPQWLPRLFTATVDGSSSVTQFQCRHLLGDDFHRFQIALPPPDHYALDSVHLVGKMVALTEAALERDVGGLLPWMREIWQGQRLAAPW
ncbi:MAG: patatin-like phospholipase family protein [Armatimonadota bacterium]